MPAEALLDHARAKHVAVRYDLRLRRRFLENRKEVTGKAHGA